LVEEGGPIGPLLFESQHAAHDPIAQAFNRFDLYDHGAGSPGPSARCTSIAAPITASVISFTFTT
jgi:hypothetical protein